MKSPLEVVMAWACLLALAVFASPAAAASTSDRTITKVVKLLEDMLEKSKEDGDKDREIYAKFKCYCDTKEAEKTENIEKLTEEINMLTADIEALLGSNGALSSDCAKLKSDIASNEQAQSEATAIRDKENKAYMAMKADSETAIDQMNNALRTLADVGADQTVSEGADHAQFMAKSSLIRLHARVKEALIAASAFAPTKKAQKFESFLQAPFTGTYTAQSGEVVGILKSMRDTFRENLAQATATEKAQLEAYDEVMKTLVDAHDEMSKSYDKKQSQMSSDDNSLATKKQSLGDAKQEKETDEEALSQLIPICEAKAKEYKERNMMRASEDSAISEAIAILNKDSAFETFGKVSATTSGATAAASFLQRGSLRSDRRPSVKAQAIKLLKAACGKERPLKLVKVLALLQADNPFKTVLAEIDKMVDLIAEEGKADKEQLDWCKAERKTSNDNIADKDTSIASLTGQIDGLITDIEDPVKGLKAMLALTETQLEDNYDSQKSQTEQRQTENKAYQEDIANLVQAQKLMSSAINVLEKYYAKIDEVAQDTEDVPATLAGETAAVPTTFESEKGYKGQSAAGDSVIKMLTFINEETAKEEATAHDDEKSAQHAFEDSMDTLKDEQETLQKSLLSLKETLAEKETELAEKKEDKKKTEEDKAAIEKYLEEIKPGCDFITTNFALREKRRKSEKLALDKAKGLIEGTPAYKNAVAEQKLEDLGKCKDVCVGAEDQAECKACLADVTVPGYCAGHPNTAGC